MSLYLLQRFSSTLLFAGLRAQHQLLAFLCRSSEEKPSKIKTAHHRPSHPKTSGKFSGRSNGLAICSAGTLIIALLATLSPPLFLHHPEGGRLWPQLHSPPSPSSRVARPLTTGRLNPPSGPTAKKPTEADFFAYRRELSSTARASAIPCCSPKRSC